MRIDPKSHARVCMTELARHEHNVEPFGYQQGGETVTEAVERESAILTDACPTNSQAERFPDLAVVQAATSGGAEHEVIGTFVRARHPAGTQQPNHRRGEHDLASSSLGLEPGVLAVARQLTMYPQIVSLIVHVGPGQTESLLRGSRDRLVVLQDLSLYLSTASSAGRQLFFSLA